ncbi:MAG: hypothetical protein AABY27_00895 [Pseudomonadota bacterium]
MKSSNPFDSPYDADFFKKKTDEQLGIINAENEYKNIIDLNEHLKLAIANNANPKVIYALLDKLDPVLREDFEKNHLDGLVREAETQNKNQPGFPNNGKNNLQIFKELKQQIDLRNELNGLWNNNNNNNAKINNIKNLKDDDPLNLAINRYNNLLTNKNSNAAKLLQEAKENVKELAKKHLEALEKQQREARIERLQQAIKRATKQVDEWEEIVQHYEKQKNSAEETDKKTQKRTFGVLKPIADIQKEALEKRVQANTEHETGQAKLTERKRVLTNLQNRLKAEEALGKQDNLPTAITDQKSKKYVEFSNNVEEYHDRYSGVIINTGDNNPDLNITPLRVNNNLNQGIHASRRYSDNNSDDGDTDSEISSNNLIPARIIQNNNNEFEDDDEEINVNNIHRTTSSNTAFIPPIAVPPSHPVELYSDLCKKSLSGEPVGTENTMHFKEAGPNKGFVEETYEEGKGFKYKVKKNDTDLPGRIYSMKVPRVDEDGNHIDNAFDEMVFNKEGKLIAYRESDQGKSQLNQEWLNKKLQDLSKEHNQKKSRSSGAKMNVGDDGRNLNNNIIINNDLPNDNNNYYHSLSTNNYYNPPNLRDDNDVLYRNLEVARKRTQNLNQELNRHTELYNNEIYNNNNNNNSIPYDSSSISDDDEYDYEYDYEYNNNIINNNNNIINNNNNIINSSITNNNNNSTNNNNNNNDYEYNITYVNTKDTYGRTALDLAAIGRHTKIMKALLEAPGITAETIQSAQRLTIEENPDISRALASRLKLKLNNNDIINSSSITNNNNNNNRLSVSSSFSVDNNLINNANKVKNSTIIYNSGNGGNNQHR